MNMSTNNRRRLFRILKSSLRCKSPTYHVPGSHPDTLVLRNRVNDVLIYFLYWNIIDTDYLKLRWRSGNMPPYDCFKWDKLLRSILPLGEETITEKRIIRRNHCPTTGVDRWPMNDIPPSEAVSTYWNTISRLGITLRGYTPSLK